MARSTSLAALLLSERRALLRGELAELEALCEAKRRAVENVECSVDAVLAAKRALERNGALIASAIAGLRAAQGRGSARRAVAEGFATYDRTGSKSHIGPIRRQTLASEKFSSNADDRGSGR